MPFVFNENTRAGAPIAYTFSYGGAEKSWGSKLMDMSDVSVKAEPLDGKFSVSELRVTLSDTDGSIWGSLGNGTTCLGSSWSATVFIGGTMSEQAYGLNGTRLYRANTGASGTYVVHSGRITDVSRKNRAVTVVSKNAMAQVADLEWRFPVRTDQYIPSYQIGSNFFFSSLEDRTNFFDFSDDRSGYSVYAYIGTEVSSIEGAYGTMAEGRGSLGQVSPNIFPGTQFYFNYTRYLFKGSNLGTYTGSIRDNEAAQRFGYFSQGDAEAAKVGGTYQINKSRLTLENESANFVNGSFFNFQQAYLDFESTPATLWREMLTGCCVNPLFATSTIEPDTFATSVRNTAFQTYGQRVDPKGGKVLPYLKNMIEPLRALFSLDSQNKFRFHTYGPRTYVDVIGTIGGSEIIDSSMSSSEEDKFNRIVLKYSFGFENGSFNKVVELKATTWSNSNDYPLEMECKWITQENDAIITAQRLVSRFKDGVPRITLDVPLTRLGADIGSLYAINDDDAALSSRVFEIVGWRKSFVDERLVRLEAWDGDKLYKQKGFAKWEDATSLTAVVSGTSTSGWGTSGTVNNINTSFFGSYFSWF